MIFLKVTIRIELETMQSHKRLEKVLHIVINKRCQQNRQLKLLDSHQ